MLPWPIINYFDMKNLTYTIRNLNDCVMNSRKTLPSAMTGSNAIYLQEQLQAGKGSVLLSLRYEWLEEITNYEASKVNQPIQSSGRSRLVVYHAADER